MRDRIRVIAVSNEPMTDQRAAEILVSEGFPPTWVWNRFANHDSGDEDRSER